MSVVDFIGGVARCLMVNAYANACDYHDPPRIRDPQIARGGGDWMNTTPATTQAAHDLAKAIVDRFVKQLGVADLDAALALFEDENADPDWSDVGHYWCMGWQGHGVCLADFYNEPESWDKATGYGETPCLSELAPELCWPCPSAGHAFELETDSESVDAWEVAQDDDWPIVMTSDVEQEWWPYFGEDNCPEWLGEREIDGSNCNVWQLADGRILAQTVVSWSGRVL